LAGALEEGKTVEYQEEKTSTSDPMRRRGEKAALLQKKERNWIFREKKLFEVRAWKEKSTNLYVLGSVVSEGKKGVFA